MNTQSNNNLGLGRRKKRKKIRKRWWFKLLLGAVTGALTGGIAGAVIGLVSALSARGGTINDALDFLKPTQQEVDDANIILTNFIAPTINNLENQINNLENSKLDSSQIISEINNLLKTIATLGAWVNNRLQDETNKVLYMVATVLDPLLITLNSKINKVLLSNGLVNNVTKAHIPFVASHTTKIGSIALAWVGTENSTYEKLTLSKGNSNSIIITGNSEDIELTAEANNTTEDVILNQTNQGSSSNDSNDSKKSTLKTVGIILGIFTILKYFANISDSKTKKDKGLKGKVCGKDRYSCQKGINKKTGNTKKGYSRDKKGKVIKKVEGLNKNGRLKKGYRFKNGKPQKAGVGLKKKKIKINL